MQLNLQNYKQIQKLIPKNAFKNVQSININQETSKFNKFKLFNKNRQFIKDKENKIIKKIIIAISTIQN